MTSPRQSCSECGGNVLACGCPVKLTPEQMVAILEIDPNATEPREPLTGGLISQRCPHCGKDI